MLSGYIKHLDQVCLKKFMKFVLVMDFLNRVLEE